MQEVNLFDVQPKKRTYRDITDEQKRILFDFGKEYYDDPSLPGYGNYSYDGRWRKTALKIARYFDLPHNAKILDVGCAKGFLLFDFKMVNPFFEVHGVDISEYAIENAMPLIKDSLVCRNCTDLPYEDGMFDLVICASVLHNLNRFDCRRAIREINRVGKEHRFIMVHSFQNEVQENNLVRWEATVQLMFDVDGWKEMLQQENYRGLYWFMVFI